VTDRSPLLQILRTPPAPGPAKAPAAADQWPAVAERLREYAARRAQASAGLSGAEGRCEFCGADIEEAHGHLVDLPRRQLLCVCRPCYLLFTHDGAGGARFRAVPERYQLVPEFAAVPELWERLQVPIGLAFFFASSATGRTTAFYPSPAGATESELSLDAWQQAGSAVPALARMAPDVEAFLVRRAARAVDALIAPIDACYELVGRIRRAWRGFQGGDEVWQEIDDFFGRVRARAESSRS
jgi:Family of unknown function (DUF5947)